MIDGRRGWDAWRPALWLLMAAAVMVGIDQGRRILATNDEARFAVLAQVPDRARFRVLRLDRLNFDQIVLVSRSPDAPRPDARP